MPILPNSSPPSHHKKKMLKSETHSLSSHLGVDFLEVRVLFIHLKIEFGGGDRKSALYYSRGGHKLSRCAQADRTCQKQKTSHTSWNDIFPKI